MEHNISTLPEYEALTTVLRRVNSQLSAAECHGLIAGALNTQNTALISRFFSEDDERMKGDAEFAELISHLVHLTAQGYRDEDFNFQLLLPDDDVSLQGRSRALAEWCGGYIMGLLESGIKEFDKLPKDAAEVAKDLVDISQLDASLENSGSDSDLMHLEEYVRVGVQVLYAVLTNTNGEESNAGQQESNKE